MFCHNSILSIAFQANIPTTKSQSGKKSGHQWEFKLLLRFIDKITKKISRGKLILLQLCYFDYILYHFYTKIEKL